MKSYFSSHKIYKLFKAYACAFLFLNHGDLPMNKSLLLLLVFSILLSSCNLPSAQLPTGSPSTQAAEFLAANQASPAVIHLRMVSIVSPANGEIYPFLSTLPVLVSAASGDADIVSQELLVNGETADTQRGGEIDVRLHWLANSPGANSLQVRIQTSDGQTLLSEPVQVNISPDPVGFDIVEPTTGVETITSLAGKYSIPAEKVLAHNPGLSVGIGDPLPAGLMIRLPVTPYIPPEVLAQAAPGVANPSAAPVNAPAFQSPGAPNFDLKVPPTFDEVYYYLSLNGGPWSRVPRLDGEFITPPAGFFNVEDALQGVVSAPSEGSLRAEVDAWGWSGGALVYIGHFEKIFFAEAGREPFAVLPGQLEICDGPSPTCAQGFGQFTGDVISNFGGKYELRWAPPPGATGGLWQVSRWPFDAACSPDPTGVFLAGGLNVAGAQSVFNLAFPAPGQDAYSIPFPQPGGSSASISSVWLPQTYYVRVLPVFGGAVKCTPSNPVTMTVDPRKQEVTVVTPTPLPAAPVPPVLFDVEIVEFKPIHFPKATFEKCVIIAENPFYEQNNNFVDGWMGGPYYVDGNVSMLQYITPGTMLCPQVYVYKEPPFVEKAGQFIKDALNTISEVYSVLKGLVVKLVVKAIPLCYSSEFIDAYKEEIDSVCNAAAEVIVAVAMSYVGLPPSIPNYEQLKDTSKGQITDLAIEQLEEQTGLPCIEICEEFIRERVDELWAAGESLLSNHQPACKDAHVAHLEGFEPLCLPGIIKTAPVPDSILQPAQAQVRITRRADAPDSSLPNSLLFKTSCSLTVSNSAANSSYVGQSIFLQQNHKTGALEYWSGEPLYAQNLFKPENIKVDLNNLAPGESDDFYLALQPNSGTFPPQGGSSFWLPGRLKLNQSYWNDNWLPANWIAYDDWEYYYLGAELTITASAICTTSPNSVQELAPSSSASSDVWVEQISSEK